MESLSDSHNSNSGYRSSDSVLPDLRIESRLPKVEIQFLDRVFTLLAQCLLFSISGINPFYLVHRAGSTSTWSGSVKVLTL